MPEERATVPGEKAKLLIVEDHIPTLQSLSAILSESGYRVRGAKDGFSALVEIRNEIPDIILSDLNMPGMSGFELLSVVRRRFPVIQVIAMSGSFSGDEVPPGVAADAFHEKGTHVGSLLQIVETIAYLQKMFSPQRPSALTPTWIAKNGHGPSGEEYVMVVCAECLRAFPQVLSESACLIQQTRCAFCHSPIDYAIVRPIDAVSSQAFPRSPRAGATVSPSVPD